MRPLRESVSENSLMLLGIPRHFCKVTLEDFKAYKEVREVKKFVQEYINDLINNIQSNKGIFFCGSNGVGKSMLSCIILKEAYRHRYTCRRVTFSQYIAYYTESWSTKDKSEKDVLEVDFYEKYKGVEVLVLEEVGKEIDSKIAKPILEDLMRYREEHGLVTIICSNSTPNEFKQSYGNSVCSLVNGNMTIITIESEDRRGENNE